LAVALAAWLAPLPSTAAELAAGGKAIVREIVDGDTVVLDRAIQGSREVRLVGIQAPKLPLGREHVKEWPFAKEAQAELARLVMGKDVELRFGGQRIDRHKRLLAHLVTADGTWAQVALLEAGLARVYTFSDNRAAAAELLAAEARARESRRAIWGHPFFQIRTPETAAKFINSFELVEATVLDAASVSGRGYLNTGPNWRTDFTVSIPAKAQKLFAQAGAKPESYKGRRIRVRGWLSSRDGPMIEATHPEQIEVLDR
jgi:endonuclease YncB( thermonuclease family)